MFGAFIGHVWGNLDKYPSHTKILAYTYTYVANNLKKISKISLHPLEKFLRTHMVAAYSSSNIYCIPCHTELVKDHDVSDLESIANLFQYWSLSLAFRYTEVRLK